MPLFNTIARISCSDFFLKRFKQLPAFRPNNIIMRNSYFKYFMHSCRSKRGFSLIEMMVVLVIVGILATGVVFMFANPTARVKGQAFTMLGDLNMARSEAVNRNVDVRVTFLPGAQDSYQIWIDDWDAGGGGGPGSDGVYTAGSDTLLQETVFPVEVQFYDKNATDGPDKKPFAPWDALDMEDGGTHNDGIELDGANEFVFTSIGTAEDSGSAPLDNEGYILIFYPAAADHTSMKVKPYGVVVFRGGGGVRIARFNKVGAVPPWRTK